MKYVSIDIETTGLDPEHCNIIEIGAVIDELSGNPRPVENLPQWHAYVLPRTGHYQGDPFALSMHSNIFKRIAHKERPYQYLAESEVAGIFAKWLSDNGLRDKINVAGKNFAAFDKQFLERLPDFKKQVKFHHRFIDPGSMYWNPLNDDAVPGTAECLRRAGLETEVAHTALQDALNVVKLVRVKALGKVQ